MEKVVATINKLQDVFDTIEDRTKSIQLPEIVVVGSQSAGKSSVMEGLVKKDFLPRGTGIVTRRPLLIRLTNVPLNDPLRKKDKLNLIGNIGDGDWATFKHLGDKIFTDFLEVRQEIEAETDRVTGKRKGISNDPISLNIYSANVVNLSLTDLPGITKVPVGDQPLDIEKQIREIIHKYIDNPNSLILAVTPANTDFATSESLCLAREVDPNGERTICVLTKLDIMDPGTDANQVLMGKIIKVKLGIIGVKNRSQADIIADKSVEKCIEEEELFLQNNYPDLADIHGIPYLADTLSKLLISHIHKCLPDLKLKIAKLLIRNQNKLATLGEPIIDKNTTILQVISRFTKAYTASLDGNCKDLASNELTCGARICYIFHDIFKKEMEEIDPIEDLTKSEILTTIRNAAGTRPALFVPENSFDFLVFKQLSRLEKPSLSCVELVNEELLRVVHHCGDEMKEERKRFPLLFERIDDILLQFLEPRVAETKVFVKKMVQIQLAYINTKHPEFNDTELAEILAELGKEEEEVDYVGYQKNTKKVSSNKSNAGVTDDTLQGSIYESNWTSRGAKTTKKIEESLRQPLTEREKRDQKLIEKLIKGYFYIVQNIIIDIVPKAIMDGIVNEVREKIRDELVKILHKCADINELVAESSTTNESRKRTSQMLDALNKADQILNKLREI
uniref:Dynamin GTPase n=1 Tax=Panagrolaimus davidi TaxID=227884 RepID=A0A914QMY5_9BILA